MSVTSSTTGTTTLGPGPLRFATMDERHIQIQIDTLTRSEYESFMSLRQKWLANGKFRLADDMILRFARNSPGKSFNVKSAFSTMKHFDKHYLELYAADIEKQLLSKTLFPIPGLKSKEGSMDMFYMRPSRYFPRETKTRQVIDNLAYCMSCMMEKEESCVNGIGFLAYMNDWEMTNFSVDYCASFMRHLQGLVVPVRVKLFLIVNPPGWFDKIWNIMQPMLSPEFRKKVHMIPETELKDFLAPGFRKFLPDDMNCGTVSTNAMVRDFVDYRKSVESWRYPGADTGRKNGILKKLGIRRK